RHLDRRLQLLYERGRVEPLEVIFGAASLDEALTSLDNLKGVTKQDSLVLRSVTAARAAFARDTRLLSARVAKIAAATQQASITAASLERSRAQRTAYISSLASQRQMNERQITRLVTIAHSAQVRSVQIAQSRATSAIPPISTPVSASSPVAAITNGRTLTVV